MVASGARILPVDVRRSLAHNSRTTGLGSAVGTTETTVAVDVSFTLTTQRRVLVEGFALGLLATPSNTNYGYVRMRSNATGSAVANTDTPRCESLLAGFAGQVSPRWQGLLAAGTYAFGLLIVEGSGSLINLNLSAIGTMTASLDAWDVGDV